MVIKSELVNDDWERIYINNKLAMEGHNISARQLMDILFKCYDMSEIYCQYTEVQEKH